MFAPPHRGSPAGSLYLAIGQGWKPTLWGWGRSQVGPMEEKAGVTLELQDQEKFCPDDLSLSGSVSPR